MIVKADLPENCSSEIKRRGQARRDAIVSIAP